MFELGPLLWDGTKAFRTLCTLIDERFLVVALENYYFAEPRTKNKLWYKYKAKDSNKPPCEELLLNNKNSGVVG